MAVSFVTTQPPASTFVRKVYVAAINGTYPNQQSALYLVPEDTGIPQLVAGSTGKKKQ